MMASGSDKTLKKRKRPRLDLTLPSLETAIEERVKSKACTTEVSEHFDALSRTQLQGASARRQKKVEETAKVCWLLSQHSIETVTTVCRTISSLPDGMTELQRNNTVAEQAGVTTEDATFLQEFLKEQCPSLLRAIDVEIEVPPVLGPPTSICYQCGSDLVEYHHCQVKYYTLQGVRIGQKNTLRCSDCKLLYNYSQFGNKRELGFRYYDEARKIVEATDTAYFERQLLELQCSLANHAWVSFQGFAESYNDTFNVPSEHELSGRLVGEAFYHGELECELRRTGKIQYRFRADSDREECMAMLEQMRRETTYPHSVCTDDCKKRGCGHLWVTDGIWKTTFPHCMFKVENCVGAIPNLNLPDVCAASPERGKAFCKEHCLLLQEKAPGVPLGLRDFLKFCGSSAAESVEDEHAIEGNAEKVDEVINKLQVGTNNVGESSAHSQGVAPLLAEHPTLLQDVALSDENEQLCRKDTGKGRRLRKWSRGHQFVVRGGGHIDTWQPLYRAESPSQVFLILLQWLLALMRLPNPPSTVAVAYDNMCNLAKLKVARAPLPLLPPLDKVWLNVHKIIDVFHFRNHVSPTCRANFSPAVLKAEHPDYNTQAGEQTFVWVGRFQHILCSMNKVHHLFYLHRMVLRRNAYTSKCYRNGKKPVLPKSSLHPFVQKSCPEVDTED